VRTKDGNEVAARVAVTRRRLYQLFAVGRGAAAAAASNGFFTSFHLEP
jgi:hypothetical protein